MRAVNLLPPDIRGGSPKPAAELAAGPEAKGGGAGPFVVLGVLAACVAGTAAYVLTNNTIEQSKSDLASVTAQQQTVQAKAAALKPYADYQAMANSRLETVRDLAGRRFDWEQALRDLSRAIPANVTLSSLNGDLGAGSGSSASPSGGSSLRASIDAPAISLQGCTSDQRSVARLMARLRSVDGVTRVSLSKSAKSGDSAGAVGTTGGQGPCGSGKRPTFELVMFFESSAAAVASPGGTAAAGTTTPSATATPTPSVTPSASATPTATATPTTTTTASATSQGGATP